MGDALWWSIGTLTTIGYDDVVPTTTEGRLVALLPMLSAVLFVATVAANLASRLFGHIERKVGCVAKSTEEELLEKVMARLNEFDQRLDRIESAKD